jgi:hypothetical protein
VQVAVPGGAWSAIEEIISGLASADLVDLERRGLLGRCAGSDLSRVIREYGATLLPLPPEGRLTAEAFETPTGLLIDVPLWTAEEGRGDLTLRVRCEKDASGAWRVSVHDLLVP